MPPCATDAAETTEATDRVTLADLLDRAQRAQAAVDALTQDTAMPLADARRRIGRTQEEVAEAMGTTQSGVSRIERQSDALVSTLDEYAAALGGRLRLSIEHGDASFPVIITSPRGTP